MAPAENGDRRFSNPAWQQYPFNVWAQAFRNNMSLIEQSARDVPGVEPRNAALVEFAARQAAEPLSPTNNPLTNPEVIAADDRRGRPEPRARLQALPRRHRAHAAAAANARHRGLPRRREGRRHRGPGHLPQRADRADPVLADDAGRASRAGADRAGLDHEVLHPRPVAEELAGGLARGPGLHGVHDLVEEPDRGGPQARHGRLPAQGRLRGARRGRPPSCPTATCMRSATASAARCSRSPPPHSPNGATRASRTSRCSPRRRTSASPASSRSTSARRRSRCSRR